MAATGSNHEERHLAQPPRGLRAVCAPGGRLHCSILVLAVLLVVALCLLALPLSNAPAEAADTTSTDQPTVTADLTAAAVGSDAPVIPIIFPLEKRSDVTYWVDTFGAPRSGGRTHAGNDLMAPKMTPILAVVDGTVDWLNLTGKLSSYNNLPYYNLLLHGDDGNDYFYIHLNNDTPGTDDGQGGPEHAYAPGLTNGSRVKTGQVIGYVGDSGNAEETAPHLHFEIHLGGYRAASTGQTRPPSAINPYASLKAAPTLAEWEAAGRPPLSTMVTTEPGDSTTTSNQPTATTAPPTTTTPTTAPSTTTTTSIPPTTVPGFVDVRTTDWFYEDFVLAREAGVVTPDPDQRFRPYSKVSRALFTVYLVRTLVPDQLRDLTSLGGPRATCTFADVSPEYWAFSEIEIAYGMGLVKGTGDGSVFSPENLVTRAQMATMIYRALFAEANEESVNEGESAEPVFKDVPAGYWAAGAIGAMQNLGLLRGDVNGYYRPLENTTRAQAVTVMARILRLLEGGGDQ